MGEPYLLQQVSSAGTKDKEMWALGPPDLTQRKGGRNVPEPSSMPARQKQSLSQNAAHGFGRPPRQHRPYDRDAARLGGPCRDVCYRFIFERWLAGLALLSARRSPTPPRAMPSTSPPGLTR